MLEFEWRVQKFKHLQKEKEWLGNVPLSLKIFNDQILDPFLPILSRWAWTRRDETRVFPTKDKLQIQRRVKEGICCTVQSCMIVASYQLERIPAAKSTNLKITDVKTDLKNVLVDWQDGWNNGKASFKITVQIVKGLAETIPETDNNSLQVERKVTL